MFSLHLDTWRLKKSFSNTPWPLSLPRLLLSHITIVTPLVFLGMLTFCDLIQIKLLQSPYSGWQCSFLLLSLLPPFKLTSTALPLGQSHWTILLLLSGPFISWLKWISHICSYELPLCLEDDFPQTCTIILIISSDHPRCCLLPTMLQIARYRGIQPVAGGLHAVQDGCECGPLQNRTFN